MGRKVKWQPSPPPLSALDKGIYATVILLSFFGPLCAIYFLAEWIPTKIIFSDPSVIAGRNNAAYFSFFVIWFYIMVVGGVIPALAADRKQPIFGNKHVKPKAGQSIIEVYPLFSKAFREHLSDKTKSTIKHTALVLAVVLVVCALIVPLGYYTGATLDHNRVLVSYNGFHRETHRAMVEDAEYMVIRIARSGKGGGPCRIYIAFMFAKKEYHFSLDEFEHMTTTEALEQMLYLKSFFDGRYELQGEKWLDRLIAEQDFSAAEIALVYELFDVMN